MIVIRVIAGPIPPVGFGLRPVRISRCDRRRDSYRRIDMAHLRGRLFFPPGRESRFCGSGLVERGMRGMDLIGKNVNAVMRRGSAWICRRVAGFSLREAAARCLIVGGILVMPWAVVMALPQRPTGVRGAILGDYLRDVSEGEDFDLEEATWWVRMGTVHSGRREIKPTENWLQWLAGFAYPALWRTQDTEALIAGGRAECSERSMILKAIVESAGHRCRFPLALCCLLQKRHKLHQDEVLQNYLSVNHPN